MPRQRINRQPGKNIYCSTYPPTLMHLSHRFTSASETAARRLLSQPLPHLCFNFNIFHPVMSRFTLQTVPTINRNEPFCPQKKTPLFVSVLLKHGRHFGDQPLNMGMLVCYIDSWSWTVLLPSDTQRKLIASITAVLLPFVTYSLTLLTLQIQYLKNITGINEFECN
jgi:hypothetical protein